MTEINIFDSADEQLAVKELAASGVLSCLTLDEESQREPEVLDSFGEMVEPLVVTGSGLGGPGRVDCGLGELGRAGLCHCGSVGVCEATGSVTGMSSRAGEDVPAASPRSPLRVETQRGAVASGRRFVDPVTGLPVIPARANLLGVVAWVGILLVCAATGLLFLEFALKPLLGLALDFWTWLGVAAPH